MIMSHEPKNLTGRGPGRPTVRTKRNRLALVRAIKQGLAPTVAAKAVGMSADTLRRWRDDDETLEGAIAKAQAQASAEMVEHVRAAAKKTWQAAAWWLERNFPEHYSQTADRPTPPSDDERQANKALAMLAMLPLAQQQQRYTALHKEIAEYHGKEPDTKVIMAQEAAGAEVLDLIMKDGLMSKGWQSVLGTALRYREQELTAAALKLRMDKSQDMTKERLDLLSANKLKLALAQLEKELLGNEAALRLFAEMQQALKPYDNEREEHGH